MCSPTRGQNYVQNKFSQCIPVAQMVWFTRCEKRLCVWIPQDLAYGWWMFSWVSRGPVKRSIPSIISNYLHLLLPVLHALTLNIRIFTEENVLYRQGMLFSTFDAHSHQCAQLGDQLAHFFVCDHKFTQVFPHTIFFRPCSTTRQQLWLNSTWCVLQARAWLRASFYCSLISSGSPH